MNIFLRDNKRLTSKWPDALQAHFSAVAVGGDNDPVPVDVQAPLVVFLHTNAPKQRSAWKQWTASGKQRFLVIVGSGGRITQTEDDPSRGTYGCHWSAAEFGAAATVRIRSFIDELKKDCFKPAFLRPAPIENLLALRLLCESWLLFHWGEASTSPKREELAEALQVDVGTYTLPEGIQLNPPHSSETWIAPFGGGSIESILKELTSDDAKSAVQSFFADVSRAQPDFVRVADLYLLLAAIVKSSN